MYKSKGKWPLLSVLVTFLIATTEYMAEGNLGEEGVILAYILRGHAVYPGREDMATSLRLVVLTCHPVYKQKADRKKN